MKVELKRGGFFVCVMALLYLAIIVFCIVYKFNPYLWFDEAGQFWISQGLNHDSNPYSQIGSLLDVIENNKYYNLDPGGFSVLLHFWIKLGTGYIWLRVLPLLFYIVAIYCWGKLLFRWTKNGHLAMLFSFIPLLITSIFPMAYELRAYSMELCGVMLTLEALEQLKAKLDKKSLLIWSVVIAVFMTSRYSFIVVAFVASLYVLCLVFSASIQWKDKIIYIIIYALPLLCSLGLIYLFALRFQNPDVVALDYLPYLSDNPNQLKSDANFKYVLSILVFAFLLMCSLKNDTLKKYSTILFMVVAVNVSFIILSMIGMHPWCIDSNRCISMIALTGLGIAAFCTESLLSIEQRVNIKWIILCVLVLYFGNTNRKAFVPQKNLLSFVQNVDFTDKKVFVDRWESPCLRYLVEYGSLKGQIQEYPNNFVFSKGTVHCRTVQNHFQSIEDWYKETQPNVEDLFEYDILLVPEMYIYTNCDSLMWKSLMQSNKIIDIIKN